MNGFVMSKQVALLAVLVQMGAAQSTVSRIDLSVMRIATDWLLVDRASREVMFLVTTGGASGSDQVFDTADLDLSVGDEGDLGLVFREESVVDSLSGFFQIDPEVGLSEIDSSAEEEIHFFAHCRKMRSDSFSLQSQVGNPKVSGEIGFDGVLKDSRIPEAAQVQSFVGDGPEGFLGQVILPFLGESLNDENELGKGDSSILQKMRHHGRRNSAMFDESLSSLGFLFPFPVVVRPLVVVGDVTSFLEIVDH